MITDHAKNILADEISAKLKGKVFDMLNDEVNALIDEGNNNNHESDVMNELFELTKKSLISKL